MQRLRLTIGFLCGVSVWHTDRDQTAENIGSALKGRREILLLVKGEPAKERQRK
jgi:hypothetical protein